MTILAIVLAIGVLAYLRASAWMWSLLAAAMLASSHILAGKIVLWHWAVLIAFAAVFSISKLRCALVSKGIFRLFKKALPPMSDTEREAIEAGDVWWEAELFRGEPDWKRLLAHPKAKLTTEELSFINNEVNTLCEMIDDWQLRKDFDMTPKVWDYIRSKGFFGLIIPKQYGGKEFGATAHSEIITKIATRSGSAAVTVMVPNSIGPAELLLKFGTEEQKNHYLPRLANGTEIPCFCLTNPNAGSDAGAIPDKGYVTYGDYNGERVLGVKLSWDKRYITLAPVATVLGMAFKLFDPEGLLGDNKSLGITLALIPSTHPGVESGARHEPLGMAFMNGPTRGKDVFIPMSFIIGGQDRVGQGWRMLMACLSEGRAISLPALSTAIAQFAYRSTGAYCRVRQQFNVPIGEFEGVKEQLAQIAGLTYQINAMRLLTSSAIDEHIKAAIVSAIAKSNMTERARRISEYAMDIQAGKGLIRGPKNYAEAAYTSVPVSITVEGANILTRSLIIFGQGAIRCHPYLVDEMMAAVTESPFALSQFDKAFWGHISYSVSKVARSIFHGATRGYFTPRPVPWRLRKYIRQANLLSAALATTSDVCLLTLGGSLKRRERISARIGDVLSNLYIVSSLLKHYIDRDCPKDELDHMDWAMQRALYDAGKAFDDTYRNLGILGKLIKVISMPIGHGLKAPSDKLDHKIVEPMLSSNAVRNKLTEQVFVSKDPNDNLAILEQGLVNRIQAEEAERKIRRAIKKSKLDPSLSADETIEVALLDGIINEREHKNLLADRQTREHIIAVDEINQTQGGNLCTKTESVVQDKVSTS